MQKTVTLSFIFFFVSTLLFSAPNPKGMIIRNTDTLYVTFIIPVTGPNFVMLQEGVRYLDSLDNESRINPGDAKEFRFEHKGIRIRMVSQFNNLSFDPDSGTTKFRHLVIDGPIKLFNYYTTGGYGRTGNQSQNYKLQKGDNNLINYDNIKFKEDLPIFLNNCPELVKRIEDKVYLKKDIEEIVKYFNANCGSN